MAKRPHTLLILLYDSRERDSTNLRLDLLGPVFQATVAIGRAPQSLEEKTGRQRQLGKILVLEEAGLQVGDFIAFSSSFYFAFPWGDEPSPAVTLQYQFHFVLGIIGTE